MSYNCHAKLFIFWRTSICSFSKSLLFFRRQVCLVSTNVIGDQCSCQDSVLAFVSFLLWWEESSLAVTIWIEDLVEHIASSFFFVFKQKCPGSHEAFFWEGFACTDAFWRGLRARFFWEDHVVHGLGTVAAFLIYLPQGCACDISAHVKNPMWSMRICHIDLLRLCATCVLHGVLDDATSLGVNTCLFLKVMSHRDAPSVHLHFH